MSGAVSGGHNSRGWWGGAFGIQWVVTTGAVQRPRVHRTAPTRRNDPAETSVVLKLSILGAYC